MPSGDERNWSRICAAVDGFRLRYGRWPNEVRLASTYFENVVGHVLSPAGFALVSSFFGLVSDEELAEDVAIIARSDEGEEFRYGEEVDGTRKLESSTDSFFGYAVLREGLDFGLDYVTIQDAEGNVIWAGKGVESVEATKPDGKKAGQESKRG